MLAVVSLRKVSSQVLDSFGRGVLVEEQVSSCSWQLELMFNIRGLFIRVTRLARLFYLSACFCFPTDEVGVTGAIKLEPRFGINKRYLR